MSFPYPPRNALLVGLALGLWALALPVRSDENWFAPNRPAGAVSSADSLASFRNDSLDAQKFRQIESGQSPKDTGKTKVDTAARASQLQQFLNRPPYFAMHGGVGFLDLSGREHFITALETRRQKTIRGRVLQPYESVNLYFPAGLLAGQRIFPYADLVLKTHSFWLRQTALIGDSINGAGQEEYYAIQGHLAGLGARVYVPLEILSAQGHGQLYVQAIPYWDLGASEMYGSHGSAKAEWSPAGSGFELQLGFMHGNDARFTWTAALSYLHTSWTSKTTWNQILPDPDKTAVKWGGNALQIQFFLFWNPRPILPPAAQSNGTQSSSSLRP